MDVATAVMAVTVVTTRATTVATSGDNGGGRGNRGCSNSGDGDSFDVGSGDDNKQRQSKRQR